MNTVLMLIFVAIVLAATGYAHYRLPYHIPTSGQLLFIRLFLIALGIAVAFVSAGYYTPPLELYWILGFLGGFGIVHVPAAVILFLKRQRARDYGH